MESKEPQQVARENPKVVQKVHEQIREILARSTTDWEFRQKLLSDPKVAIEDHTGNEVSEDLEISFVDNQSDVTFVLPDYQDPETELVGDELGVVTGGGEPGPSDDSGGDAFWYHVARGAGMIAEQLGIVQET